MLGRVASNLFLHLFVHVRVKVCLRKCGVVPLTDEAREGMVCFLLTLPARGHDPNQSLQSNGAIQRRVSCARRVRQRLPSSKFILASCFFFCWKCLAPALRPRTGETRSPRSRWTSSLGPLERRAWRFEGGSVGRDGRAFVPKALSSGSQA